jgi:hypothetical protein
LFENHFISYPYIGPLQSPFLLRSLRKNDQKSCRYINYRYCQTANILREIQAALIQLVGFGRATRPCPARTYTQNRALHAPIPPIVASMLLSSSSGKAPLPGTKPRLLTMTALRSVHSTKEIARQLKRRPLGTYTWRDNPRFGGKSEKPIKQCYSKYDRVPDRDSQLGFFFVSVQHLNI